MKEAKLRNAGIRQRLAREHVAARGWSGMKGAFVVDGQKARREARADMRSSGSDHDDVLEAAAGCVIGPARALVWSERRGAYLWWRYEAGRAKWMPEAVDRAESRRLRVELSDANEGRSPEEVLARELSREGSC